MISGFSHRTRGRGAVLVAMGLVLFVLGCSSRGGLKGKVTYKGKALAGGTVSVLDSRGEVTQAEIGSDGSYSIPKVATGEAKVSVTYVDPKINEEAKRMATQSREGKGTGKEPAPFNPGKVLEIPEHYSDFDRSGLRTQIQGKPDNEMNIDIP